MLSALETPGDENKVYTIGGPEYFSFREVLDILAKRLEIRRSYFPVHASLLRSLWLFLEQGNRRFPVSIHWLDYLAADRTCPVDSVAREFGLLPSRFTQHLDHLNPNPKKRNRKNDR
jgi:NADH dehydrogenase